jgi:uroporphyrinogen III methyltransferase / synthase
VGKVYLVGAGPGDPALITVRGKELISQADCIIYDFLAGKDLLAHARAGAELIYAGKQASHHELPQQEINGLLFEKAMVHEVVVRLKGGDPFVFGRGGEEVLFLAERGIDFEIVPGVTSATSVPAYAGIPLTHRDYASTVAFITGHEDEKKDSSTIAWRELARGIDTLVFLMGIGHIGNIADKLIKEGKDALTPAAVIEWGTLPRQRVVTGPLRDIATLAGEAGIRPPGIIVIGKVASLRERLRWFEKRPLFGWRIAITRAREQSLRLGELLTTKGAEVLYIPTIEISPIEPNRPLDDALARLHGYDYIVFTSVNGVSAFFDHLWTTGRDARLLASLAIVAIGPATTERLTAFGVRPDIVPARYTSEGINEALKNRELTGKRLLMPRAEDASDVVVKEAVQRGATCDTVAVYRTSLPEKIEAITEQPHLFTFTSSSTVTNFLTLYGRTPLEGAIVASIGPVTSQILTSHNIPVHIEAARSDIPGLIAAIESYALTHGISR